MDELEPSAHHRYLDEVAACARLGHHDAVADAHDRQSAADLDTKPLDCAVLYALAELVRHHC